MPLPELTLGQQFYGGYAETPLNPEPDSYETGFAVKDVIAAQIAGEPKLSYRGRSRAPWLAWGPYLWADGLRPRSDGLTYLRDDLMADGTHPSDPGREKVARQLLKFFTTDPTGVTMVLAVARPIVPPRKGHPMRRIPIFLAAVFLFALPIGIQGASVSDFSEGIHDIDTNKAMSLMVKLRQGETLSEENAAFARLARTYMETIQQLRRRQRNEEVLTAEESGFLDLAQAAQHKRQQAARAAFLKRNPPRDSTGLIPLTELAGGYKGEPGRLYAGGNKPSGSHLAEGLRRAGAIGPLNAEGKPDEHGSIVLISVGMSNTTQEFRVFAEQASGLAGLNSRLVIVDGAQGGQSAGITANPEARYWTVADERLTKAGVTAGQVQVAWIKQAIPRPQEPFPAEAKKLQGFLEGTVQVLASRFPNLRIAYLSSRIYGGYAEGDLNPEPFAYEDGFATKWLIADQMAGKPELNYSPSKAPVRAPWLAWGPYLWADGLRRRSDGYFYAREDLAEDGTHPSDSGRVKVAGLLLTFFKTDPTARPWFLADADSGAE